MRMNQLPIGEKPREKLLRDGPEGLSTVEVLAVILGTGTRSKSVMDLAGEVLAMDARGLRYLAECSPEDLKTVSGMGEAKVCMLMAALELGKRLSCLPAEDRVRIKCPDDIANLFLERLRYEKKEHFKCLLINSRGEILEEHEVSIGDLNSSASHPREVFSPAVRRSAGSVAFVHNHPSGDPSPSDADIDSTRRLVEAGNLLGIPVIDHIIIGDGTYISMKGLGYIT
ncbi:MAG: DNA repair protein RadC [Clostridia bacterium]|nr:DNA repair protein RadC [Clostridia bacterium]